MGIHAYVCVQLGVPNGKQGCMFTPAKVQITSYEPEIVGLQMCAKGIRQLMGNKPESVVEPTMDLEQIAQASSKLSVMLEQVLNYVDDVLSAKVPPDNQVNYKKFYFKSF